MDEQQRVSIGVNSCAGILLVYFVIIQNRFLHLDLWNDEVYTFKFFILQSYRTIVTDYHVPNNHILLNLFYRLYLDITGIRTLSDAFNHPFLLRLPQLIFAVITLIFTFRASGILFNKKVALLSLLLLVTTIPYVNFTPQIRGYNLSMMLFLLLFYYSLRYFEFGRKTLVPLISIFTALLIYTIPSNMYTVITMETLLGGLFILKLWRPHLLLPYTKQATITLMFAILGGVLLSFLLYYPVLKHVFLNDYVSYVPFRFSNLLEYFPHVIHCFNSNRGILFAVAAAVTIFFFKNAGKSVFGMIGLSGMVLGPFLLVFVLGNNVPDRVFVTLAPLYAICIASFFDVFFIRWLTAWQAKGLFIGMMAIYCIINLNLELCRIDRELMADIESDGRRQDLYFNYYLAHFRPQAEVSAISNDETLSKLPVLIAGCEPHDIPHYLEEKNLAYLNDSVNVQTALSDHQSILLVTNHPNKVPQDSNFHVKKLSPDNNYHTFFLLTNIKSPD